MSTLPDGTPNPPIDMTIDTLTAMCVIANIQLATRHHANTGPSSRIARQFAQELTAQVIKNWPDKAAIIEMGWNPDFDF